MIVRSSLALLHAMVDSPCELRDVRKGLSFLGIALPHALDVNGEPLPVLEIGGVNGHLGQFPMYALRSAQSGPEGSRFESVSPAIWRLTAFAGSPVRLQDFAQHFSPVRYLRACSDPSTSQVDRGHIAEAFRDP